MNSAHYLLKTNFCSNANYYSHLSKEYKPSWALQ
jgi:hypothetical protein